MCYPRASIWPCVLPTKRHTGLSFLVDHVVSKETQFFPLPKSTYVDGTFVGISIFHHACIEAMKALIIANPTMEKKDIAKAACAQAEALFNRWEKND